MKVYMAGPLFTAAEIKFNTSLAQLLTDAGHEVFLPQEKCIGIYATKEICDKCIEGIDWCDVVLANMDGPIVDDGTAFECGYAYGKKPIVGYRTDFRTSGDSLDVPVNLMLFHACVHFIVGPDAEHITSEFNNIEFV